jgi:sarcosine oxidase
MRRVDAVVVGAGVMGSAAALHLARRHRSVVVLERFQPGHRRGSSHGASRVFRLAYAEPDYVRLAQRAEGAWRALEADAGEPLLDRTGAIDHGDPAGVAALAEALDACGVEHEVLATEAAAERWPGVRFDGPVLHHPAGGRCRSDHAVAALQRRAGEEGAELRFGVPAEALVPAGAGVEVRTADGAWRAPVAVVATGAWLPGLLGPLVDLPPLRVTREQWLHLPPRDGGPERWPSFIHHLDPAAVPAFVYGLGTPGEGVKVAEHHTGPEVDPDRRGFEADEAGVRRLRRYVERRLPGLDPGPASVTTCLYTSTPTEDFVLDRTGPLVVVSPCSGHGFKFAPELGRLAADLAEGRPPEVARFTLAAHRRARARPARHR